MGLPLAGVSGIRRRVKMNGALKTMTVAAILWLGFGAASGALAQAQRSAQSDCAREAERRGYTTLATRNFQQYKDGWSLELQTRDRAGRVTWSSCFVETRTGDVSLYGLGWSGGGGGGTGNTGNLFEFNCSSTEGKYRECQLPVDGRARLVKQKSGSPCVEGQSWGQRGDRLWVDRGTQWGWAVPAVYLLAVALVGAAAWRVERRFRLPHRPHHQRCRVQLQRSRQVDERHALATSRVGDHQPEVAAPRRIEREQQPAVR